MSQQFQRLGQIAEDKFILIMKFNLDHFQIFQKSNIKIQNLHHLYFHFVTALILSLCFVYIVIFLHKVAPKPTETQLFNPQSKGAFVLDLKVLGCFFVCFFTTVQKIKGNIFILSSKVQRPRTFWSAHKNTPAKIPSSQSKKRHIFPKTKR